MLPYLWLKQKTQLLAQSIAFCTSLDSNNYGCNPLHRKLSLLESTFTKKTRWWGERIVTRDFGSGAGGGVLGVRGRPGARARLPWRRRSWRRGTGGGC